MATLAGIRQSARDLGTERIYLLAMLTAGHVVVHWYQQLFSLIVPELRSSLGLSNVQVGTLNTVRQVTSGLTLPSGYIADSYRRHTNMILAAAILSFGLGYLFIGVGSGYAWALIAVALIGLGTALWHPAAMGSLSVTFRERRGMALSVHGAGASIGDSVVPLIVGAMLLVVNWQLALQLHFLPAILGALILWATLKNAFVDTSDRPTLRSYLGNLAQLLRNSQVLGVFAANTLSQMARLAVTAFFPIYVTETLGYSSFVLGVYLALLYAMGLVSQPVMGVVSDREGRKVVLVISFALMTALFALIVMTTNGIILGIVVAALGCFFYGTVNITQSAVMDVAGENVQASTMGLMALIGQPFALASPILTGVLTDAYGLEATFWYAAALQAAATLVLLPVRFRRVAG